MKNFENSKKKWSKDDIELIKKYYPFNPNKRLSIHLKRSVSSIQNMAIKLELKKDIDNPEFFQKGARPWNKGKTGYMGANRTSFKKGNIPPQNTYDGAVRIRTKRKTGEKYKYIRLSKGNWTLLHRLNWIKKYGPIPVNMILRCKSRDTLNCDTDNWELITRAQNCRLNENRKKASISMKESWRKRKIMQKYFDWIK